MVRVEVVFSAAPRQVESVMLALPAGSTVGAAIAASGLVEQHGLAIETVGCGLWGRRCTLGRALRDGDRVELYRALTVDPKQARRLRYKGQRRPKRP
jgi:putative ubiquitin-RnfH superfamily antitoxin RatB of RatAB toxin-antitoxin module